MAGYTIIEAVVLAWLFGWSLHGAMPIVFFSAAALLAGVYNLFTCDWIAGEVVNMAGSNQRIGEYVLMDRIAPARSAKCGRPIITSGRTNSRPSKFRPIRNTSATSSAKGVAIHGLVHPNIVRAIGFDPYAAGAVSGDGICPRHAACVR